MPGGGAAGHSDGPTCGERLPTPSPDSLCFQEPGAHTHIPPPGQQDPRDASAASMRAFPYSPPNFSLKTFRSDWPTLSFSQSRLPRSQHRGGVSGGGRFSLSLSLLICVIISSTRASAIVKSEPSSINTSDLKSHIPFLYFRI